MANNGIVTTYDDAGFPTSPTRTTVISAAGSSAIKTGPGRLITVVVTAASTGTVTFYDNASAASGTILLVVPASPTVGAVYSVALPAANGIFCVAASSTSSVAVGWS